MVDDGVHLKIVGQHDAVVAEFLPQKFPNDRRRQGGRTLIVQRVIQHMGRHHRRDAVRRRIAAAVKADGGLMSYEDLATYQGRVERATDRIRFLPNGANGTNNIGEFLAIVHALAMRRKYKQKK